MPHHIQVFDHIFIILFLDKNEQFFLIFQLPQFLIFHLFFPQLPVPCQFKAQQTLHTEGAILKSVKKETTFLSWSCCILFFFLPSFFVGNRSNRNQCHQLITTVSSTSLTNQKKVRSTIKLRLQNSASKQKKTSKIGVPIEMKPKRTTRSWGCSRSRNP